MLKEACVENFTKVPSVIQRGAQRIELCDNLAAGGTTPSVGVMKKAIKYCHEKEVTVAVMLRPRGGNFVYTPDEKKIMVEDLKTILNANADAVVMGALTDDNQLDEAFLIEIAKQVKERQRELVFHMAFDEIPADKQKRALHRLEEIGFDRILTHGGPMSQSIFETVENLEKLMEWRQTITILPGGGITKDNLAALQEKLSFQEVHGTKIV